MHIRTSLKESNKQSKGEIMDMDKAWLALWEGDLTVLAEELGIFEKKEVDQNGYKENKGLCETGCSDDYSGGENPCLTKEALGQKDET